MTQFARANCDFFGGPSTLGFCSACYKQGGDDVEQARIKQRNADAALEEVKRLTFMDREKRETAAEREGKTIIIIEQPKSRIVRRLHSVSFRVVAKRSSHGNQDKPITYQWYFRGKPIAGAVRNMLVVRSVRHRSEGVYRCFVSIKDCGKAGEFTEEAYLQIDPLDVAVEQRLVQHLVSIDDLLGKACSHDAVVRSQKALSDKSTQLYPELHFQLLQALAIAKCQLGDIRGAIADLSKALCLSVPPQDPKIQDCITAALQLRAKLYLQVRPPRYTGAIADLEKVLSRAPPSSRADTSSAAASATAGVHSADAINAERELNKAMHNRRQIREQATERFVEFMKAHRVFGAGKGSAGPQRDEHASPPPPPPPPHGEHTPPPHGDSHHSKPEAKATRSPQWCWEVIMAVHAWPIHSKTITDDRT